MSNFTGLLPCKRKDHKTKAKFILIYKLFKDLAGDVSFVFQDGGTDRMDDHIASLT